MRKKVIAGNWKMNLDLKESVALISEIKNGLEKIDNIEVIVCPPFTSLETAKTLLVNSGIFLGAQNMYFEENGAFTGEISASMLKSVGCQYVIIGHSERRTIFKETDEVINKKLKKAIEHGLKPIFCVGESLDEREKNLTTKIVERQIQIGLKEIPQSDLKSIIIAYEPVWAIGTGRTATPDQAQEVHKFIRDLIKDLYDKATADKIIIQYGGSVKPENSGELLSRQDIDGALVGGACLKSASFLDIIKSA